jgi:hypothetical protein
VLSPSTLRATTSPTATTARTPRATPSMIMTTLRCVVVVDAALRRRGFS